MILCTLCSINCGYGVYLRQSISESRVRTHTDGLYHHYQTKQWKLERMKNAAEQGRIQMAGTEYQ